MQKKIEIEYPALCVVCFSAAGFQTSQLMGPVCSVFILAHFPNVVLQAEVVARIRFQFSDRFSFRDRFSFILLHVQW